ncbi:trypsin-like peptidase domain-containing protein [Streptomyces roseoverticillatus]|uniref:trypsin-like serine peptidase n=1 Tax=Streptomyces roseoverticillatus TaxID=66429 RepID=UPI001F1BAE7F|nr:trypsin-like peptidase domain-containing protein [Streptomyces roseoverticillatus]MCF3106138.1 trypsin-like peptidase domain-containing protein [Streptomyces roseoverticillatus]
MLALVAALLTAAPPAQADVPAFELLPLVPAGAGHQQKLKSEVEYWTLAKMASTGLNNEQQDATPPPGGWDDLSRPWPREQGLISRTAGKFFIENKDVQTGAVSRTACSGNVVTSANQSVVVTAAHCLRVHTPVNVGFGNTMVTNMVFVPGFNGANLPRNTTSTDLPGKDIAPYGVWGVTREWITSTWSRSADWLLGHDMAAVLVANPGDPRPIGQVTGAQQIGFDQPRNQNTYVFGYPTINERNYYRPGKVRRELQRTFDGRSLMTARAITRSDPVYYSDVMPGALSPGTSGGPVLQNLDPATGAGVQTGVFSRYDDPGQIIGLLGWVEGPNLSSTHLGDEERAVHDAAQAESPAGG